MVVGIARFDLDDRLILLNGQLQHFLRLASGLRVAQRTQINPAQQLARLQVLGIALDDVLGLGHCIANATGAGIEFRQTGVQEL